MNNIENLPTHIFVGPIKTGTTWIYEYLSQHSAVSLSHRVKETFFFDRYFDKGLNFYRSHFEKCSALPLVEVGPSYAGDRNAFARIKKTLPNIKIIITIREPSLRTLSQYQHELRYGYYSKDINCYLSKNDPMFQRSNYPKILAEAVSIFGSENVSILSFEELRSNPKTFCVRICKILNIPFIEPPLDLVCSNINSAQMPRNRVLSKFATTVADEFRKHGLAHIPTLARRLGFRKLIEKKNNVENPNTELLEKIREINNFDYSEFKENNKDFIPKI